MRKIILLLAAAGIFVSGCGGAPKGMKRFAIGSEKRYEIRCVEGGREEVYEWVKISIDDSAFSSEKRIWDFVGKRKSDGKVLRVVNTNCRMETGEWI